MSPEEIRDLLRGTSLFATFTDEQLDVVPKIAPPRVYAPGTSIVERGDERTNSMWLILDGEAEVSVSGVEVGRLGPGEHFGEIALLTDTARGADVTAATPMTAIELKRSHLEGLIASDSNLGLKMLAEIARRLKESNDRLEELLGPETKGRHSQG